MFRLCPRHGGKRVDDPWLQREPRSSGNEGLLNGLNCVFLRILICVIGVCWSLDCVANFDMMKAAGERWFMGRVETGFF